MKKIILLILIGVLSGCQSISPQEETFKNPLFYKKMENLSSNYFWDMKLTPTTMTSYLRRTDTVLVQKCELTDNTQKYVTLVCENAYYPSKQERIKCIIDDNNKLYAHVQCYTNNNEHPNPEKKWHSIDNYSIRYE